MSKLRLDLEWRTTLLTLFLVPALLGLGVWQLERAEEKRVIAEQNLRRAETPETTFASVYRLPDVELSYRRVELRGEFLPEAVIFLDNQIRDGRYGHDAYGLFLDSGSGEILLLNRGWVEGDSSRRSLPTLEVPSGDQRLSAVIYVPPGEPYLLADEQFADLQWPLLVQSAVAPTLRAAIADRFGRPVFARELRLLPDQPLGFRRDWPVVNVSPEKHRGYAVQWFTMAAALAVLFVFRSSNLGAVLRGAKGEEN